MCILYNIWFSCGDKTVIVSNTIQYLKLTDMLVTKKGLIIVIFIRFIKRHIKHSAKNINVYIQYITSHI